MNFKTILKALIPKKTRLFLWSITPRVYRLNTYLLKRDTVFEKLSSIETKYYIKVVDFGDLDKLKLAYSYRGTKNFDISILPRLNSSEWVGLAVIDNSKDEIAYIAWVVAKSITYIEEFGIRLKQDQFLLKDGFCVPHYRHQGLHTRMEQERINYSIKHGAKELFIQIHDSNTKGKVSVEANGYKLYKKNLVLSWRIFNIYRELFSAVMNPFKKIVK